jgi:hypothetical protein
MSKRPPINFDYINRFALCSLPVILGRWLPRGRREGLEYVALNPTRNDRAWARSGSTFARVDGLISQPVTAAATSSRWPPISRGLLRRRLPRG